MCVDLDKKNAIFGLILVINSARKYATWDLNITLNIR